MFKNPQKAVSLYLALIIMFILLSIGLGVSLIIVSQMKMMKGMGDSVIAFYAADTGIEHALYEERIVQNPNDFTLSDTVGTDASYTVTYIQTTGVAQSTGGYKGVKRAVEIKPSVLLVFEINITPTSVATCIGIAECPFSPVTVDADGNLPKLVTFSTDGVDIGGGCFSHLFGGAKFKACFNPPSCNIACSSILTLTVTQNPPLNSNISTTIKVRGTADSLMQEKTLDVRIMKYANCAPWCP